MIDGLTLGVVPFRGSWALQRGLLIERQLRGRRYHRLFQDIYLLASAPADLAARSQGAARMPGRGVFRVTRRRSCSVHDVRRWTRTRS